MIRRLQILIAVITINYSSQGQNNFDYTTFSNTGKRLETSEKTHVKKLFDSLSQKSKITFTYNDSVIFLLKSNTKSVEWMGDFNGWGFQKNFSNKGNQIPGTDICILKASFPKDARLDYKILIDGTNWILDPENKFQQWSGVSGGSPNSELRMPEWKEDPIQLERQNNH